MPCRRRKRETSSRVRSVTRWDISRLSRVAALLITAAAMSLAGWLSAKKLPLGTAAMSLATMP